MNRKIAYSFSLLLLLALQACGVPAVVTDTTIPLGTGSAPSGTTESAETPVSAISTNVVHVTTPGIGTKQEANAHDNDEATTFQSKDVQTGDQFMVNRFERPFTSKDMEYLPYVDIKNMSIASDDAWYYLQIELVGLGEGRNSPQGVYGAEFDINLDGRAEILVLVNPPFNLDWSTGGVAVYFDQNGNLGGSRMYPDSSYTGDGYEEVVVDSGIGNDPDLAWARFVETGGPMVELALKRSLFHNTTSFMWNVLASAKPIEPTDFYYNDTITLARAGSPRKNNKFYPVKLLWGFDNTCRVPFGFQATGSEPMGCNVAYESEEPGDIGFGGDISLECGGVWSERYDTCIELGR